MKFYIADAFTDNLFGGNPAGVVMINGDTFPVDEVMKKTAAELRYSETAFVKKMSDTTYNIRYFTPADEVDLCGHATIASFRCLLDAGLVESGHSYTNETLAGAIGIDVSDDCIMMDVATPDYISTIDDTSELERLYSITGSEYTPPKGPDGEVLFPMVISTGLPDIIMPVHSRGALNAMKPDFPRLSELSKKYGVVSVHAFALPSADTGDHAVTAYCRDFAPLYGINEEAATGTANGSLTYYLYKNNLIDAVSRCTFIQGEAMDRASAILATIDASDKVSIRVGGNASILAKGDIYI